MGFTRRTVLALAGAIGLTGCSAPQAGTATEENQQNSERAKTNRTIRHFNNGKLISPVNNESVSTEEAVIGEETPYPFVSNIHTTVTVPGDYDTIQAAVDDAPKHNRHEYIIDVSDGHTEGHVQIRGHSQEGFSTGNRGFGAAGENYQIQILGNKSDPSQVKIDSLTAVGCKGVETPQIWGVRFQGVANPDYDEANCVGFSGCDEVFLGDCQFRNPNSDAAEAVQVYGSGAHIRRVDFGTDVFSDAIVLKRISKVSTKDNTGSVTGNHFRVEQLGTAFEENSGLGENYNLERGGEVRRMDDGTVHHYGGTVSYGDGGGSAGGGIHYHNATYSQSVAGDGTWHRIEYNNEVRDTDGGWDSTNHVFTAAEAGVYQLDYSVLWNNVSSGTRVETRAVVAGSNRAADMINVDNQGAYPTSGSGTFELSSGDTIYVQAKHGSGSSADVGDYTGGTYITISQVS